MASKPGGLNDILECQSSRKSLPAVKSLGRVIVGSRPVCILSGKAVVAWEEPGTCTRRPTGIEDQASRERLAEITSGTTILQ